MRVREPLAAIAICLLALTGPACRGIEQPLGAYDPERGPPNEPLVPPPAPSEGGSDGATIGDGGLTAPVIDRDASGGEPSGGAAGSRPSFAWPPPMLLDAGAPPGSNPPECAYQVVTAERRRLDMYLMVDNNSTLPASGAWEDVTEGLDQFVDDDRSAGVGVGIRYYGSTCNAREYAEPTIDIDLLPANAKAIRASTKQRRWTASPMLPALEGGLQLARARAVRHPEWKQVVVLVSDALTQDFTCLYTTQGLAETASEGLNGIPSIETHVIGVGVTTELSDPLDELITRVGAYNTIARAGGSEEAVVTPLNDDGTAFGEALQAVRRRAAPCEFREPAGVATSQFGVVRYPLATELQRFPNERSCGNEQGWFYAIEALPTPVTMCPATCEWLRETDENQIAMVIACPEQP